MHYLLLAEPRVFFWGSSTRDVDAKYQVMLAGNEPWKYQDEWDEIGRIQHWLILKAELYCITRELLNLDVLKVDRNQQ